MVHHGVISYVLVQEDAKRLTSGNVKEEVNLDQQHPISNFRSAAIDQHESIGNMIDRLGLPSDMLPVHDARMSVSREERVAQTAGKPFFGIVDRSLGVTPGSGLSAQSNGHPDGHPEVSHKWRARDFVARSVARPVRSTLCFPLHAGQGRSAVVITRACSSVVGVAWQRSLHVAGLKAGSELI